MVGVGTGERTAGRDRARLIAWLIERAEPEPSARMRSDATAPATVTARKDWRPAVLPVGPVPAVAPAGRALPPCGAPLRAPRRGVAPWRFAQPSPPRPVSTGGPRSSPR